MSPRKASIVSPRKAPVVSRKATGGLLGVLLGALLLGAPAALSGKTLLLVVSGVGGEESFEDAFYEWSSSVLEAAREGGMDPEHMIYLAEDPDRDTDLIQGPARRENVQTAIAELLARFEEGDDFWVILFGHGSSRNGEHRFNLLGPDMTVGDFAALLDERVSSRLVFVNASSASGGFVEGLSSPGRAIVTATRSERERHATTFGGYFAEALLDATADLDKDERVSLLEAFNYAKAEVDRRYRDEGLLPTEHAVLDDNGDGEGSLDPSISGPDGALSSRFFLVGQKIGGEVSPEIQALLTEKAELEERVVLLRAQKDSLDEELYRSELQALLLALAEKSEEIRDLVGEDEE